MRLTVLMVLAALTAPVAASPKQDVPAKLHRYYGTTAGYTKVHRDVMGWHKTTQNGCVAFASTALRHVGVEIPFDVRKDGFSVSRITRAFSRYLSEDLGWERIEAPDSLRPGDVVFTVDAGCCPGYPAHVMIFDGWLRRDRTVGRFIDNQGFRVARAMTGTPSRHVDGFGYALRPPGE
jgi:hypothetical protein